MSERTEEPTQKKLRDARKRGEVAKSKDFPKAAVFLVFVLWLSASGAGLVDRFAALLTAAGHHAGMPFSAALANFLELALRELVQATLVPLGLMAAVALAAEMFNTGIVFAPERLAIKFDNLSPLKSLKNWFSMRNLVELFKSLLKIGLIGGMCAMLVMRNIDGIVWSPAGGAPALTGAMAKLLQAMLFSCAIAFVAFAAADVLLQKRIFLRGQRMSKDEVKREYKESEGDPHIKGHRKQMHRELMREPAKAATRKSSAVVVNPTHIAVALRYVPGETPLPLVMATGRGELARVIREEAEAAGIPVVRVVPLARALERECEPDDYIPLALMDDVAAVLAGIEHLLPDRSGSDPPAPLPGGF